MLRIGRLPTLQRALLSNIVLTRGLLVWHRTISIKTHNKKFDLEEPTRTNRPEVQDSQVHEIKVLMQILSTSHLAVEKHGKAMR
jgi:hypothetical protein